MPRPGKKAKPRNPGAKKLSAEVWRWLQAGRPEKPDHAHPAPGWTWDAFVLEGEAVNGGVVIDAFWDRVLEAVEDGSIEVVEGYTHHFGDPPIVDLQGLPSRADAWLAEHEEETHGTGKAN